MRQHLSVLSIIVSIFFILSAQSGSAQPLPYPNNTYKCFTGTVGTHPVHAYISCIGKRVNGWYARDDQPQIPIPLVYENQKSSDSLLILAESARQGDSGKAGSEWQCRFSRGRLTGRRVTQKGPDRAAILLKEDYPAGTYPFAIRTFNHTYDALPGNDSTPQWETTYVFPVSEGTGTSSGWINRQIKLLLNGRPGMDFDSIIRGRVNTGLKAYREAINEIKGAGLTVSMNHESILQVFVDYNKDNFLVINRNIYEYAGGAHGNYASIYNCFDVLQKKQLRLTDLIATDSLTLQQLLEAQYRKDNHLQPADTLTDLFDNQLPLTYNFYFNGRGIGFVYTPYEIAPYAAGITEIFLPYENLQKYLRPVFKKRMQIRQ